MNDLVALDIVPGPALVAELVAALDAGDAVTVLDARLPPPARASVLAALRPTVLVTQAGERRPLPDGEPVADGDALVVATSGTTGEPKGVVLDHGAVAAAARITAAALEVDPARDRFLACLPLAHIGGLSVLTRALWTGTPLVVHPRFDAAAVEAAARAEGATLVSLVATALRRIDASVFRRILVGGGPAPEGLPPNAVTTYGMTETCGGVVYDGVALEGVEVRVVDGEIQLRGPTLLRCYRDGSDPRTPDGWLPTGDLGELSPDGRLRVLGRREEVIVTGGEKVFPGPVEAVLATVEGVVDVAVAGRPDPEWGERVVAYVVPADRRRPPRLAELRAAAKASLPPYAAPTELVLVERLARSALGKLRRAELRAGPSRSSSA